MNNVQTIIKACEITEDVHGQGNVDLIGYIENEKLVAFTRTNGARDMVANLDYEEVKDDIARAIINSAITGLEHPNNVRNLANNIPGLFIEWARRESKEEDNNTISEIFSNIYADPFNSSKVIASLRESRTYSEPEYEKYSEEVVNMIRILEEAKETLKEKSIVK